jgi:hypothetical protein
MVEDCGSFRRDPFGLGDRHGGGAVRDAGPSRAARTLRDGLQGCERVLAIREAFVRARTELRYELSR